MLQKAIETMPPEGLKGKTVFIETSNLDSYDKPYVIQRLREAVLSGEARLANSKEEADIVLEVASGGLSINRRDWLLGLPAIPLPIPYGGEWLKLPEIAIFKVVFYTGRAKLPFSAVDSATSSRADEVPMCYGRSLDSYWWILFMGPFRYSDHPKGAKR